MKKLFWALLSVVAMVACDKGGDDAPKSIELTGGTSTSQALFADETSTKNGIQFTAKEAWTATVTESTSKAGGSQVDWLTLSAYEGGAGNFVLTMTLSANTTGHNRQAQIRIVAGETAITITVDQRDKTESGEVPYLDIMLPEVIIAENLNIVEQYAVDMEKQKMELYFDNTKVEVQKSAGQNRIEFTVGKALQGLHNVRIVVDGASYDYGEIGVYVSKEQYASTRPYAVELSNLTSLATLFSSATGGLDYTVALATDKNGNLVSPKFYTVAGREIHGSLLQQVSRISQDFLYAEIRIADPSNYYYNATDYTCEVISTQIYSALIEISSGAIFYIMESSGGSKLYHQIQWAGDRNFCVSQIYRGNDDTYDSANKIYLLEVGEAPDPQHRKEIASQNGDFVCEITPSLLAGQDGIGISGLWTAASKGTVYYNAEKMLSGGTGYNIETLDSNTKNRSVPFCSYTSGKIYQMRYTEEKTMSTNKWVYNKWLTANMLPSKNGGAFSTYWYSERSWGDEVTYEIYPFADSTYLYPCKYDDDDTYPYDVYAVSIYDANGDGHDEYMKYTVSPSDIKRKAHGLDMDKKMLYISRFEYYIQDGTLYRYQIGKPHSDTPIYTNVNDYGCFWSESSNALTLLKNDGQGLKWIDFNSNGGVAQEFNLPTYNMVYSLCRISD